MLYTQVLKGRGSQPVCQLSVLSGNIRANRISQGATLPQTWLLTTEIKRRTHFAACNSLLQNKPQCSVPKTAFLLNTACCSHGQKKPSDGPTAPSAAPHPCQTEQAGGKTPQVAAWENFKGPKGVRTYLGELGWGQITRLAAGQQVKLTSSIQACVWSRSEFDSKNPAADPAQDWGGNLGWISVVMYIWQRNVFLFATLQLYNMKKCCEV